MFRVLVVAVVLWSSPSVAEAAVSEQEAKRAIRLATREFRASITADGAGLAPLHFGACHKAGAGRSCRARAVGTWQTCRFSGRVTERADTLVITLRGLSCR